MNDKKTLISIVVLLVIFLPMAIYGTYINATKQETIVDDNPNKDYILNNKVYFYADGNLTSTYECSGVCTIPEVNIDDSTYNVHYYKFGSEDVPTILNNDYALFKEGESIVLYSVATETKLLYFNAIKTYNVKHTDPILIVRSNGKYGVISTTNMVPLIGYKYDYIGIPNRVKDGVLDTSKFIAKDGNRWFVLEKDGNYNHDAFYEKIVDFNDKYIITESFGSDRIFDYNNNEYMTEYNFKSVYCIGNYIFTIDNYNNLNVYSDVGNSSINTLVLPEYETIDFKYENNKVEIYLDNNNYQSIVLS